MRNIKKKKVKKVNKEKKKLKSNIFVRFEHTESSEGITPKRSLLTY